MKALRQWLGDKTESEEETTDTEDDSSTWDTVERQKKNKLKKKLAQKKILLNIERTIKKASHSGDGPDNNG